MSLIIAEDVLEHAVLELLVNVRFHHVLLRQLLLSLTVDRGNWFFQGLNETFVLGLSCNRLINIVEVFQVLRRLSLLLQQAVRLAHRVAIAIDSL